MSASFVTSTESDPRLDGQGPAPNSLEPAESHEARRPEVKPCAWRPLPAPTMRVELGHTFSCHTVKVSDEEQRVDRRPYVVGRIHLICFSVRTDRTKPAEEMLRQLATGEWRDDTDHAPAAPWPDEHQASDRHLLLQMIRNFADEGKPRTRTSVNTLGSGVWEFKRGVKRITFYDTDGSGTKHIKAFCMDFATADRQDDMWKYPNFDKHLRLGHGFAKDGQTTKQDDIDEALAVREEDLEHDRAA